MALLDNKIYLAGSSSDPSFALKWRVEASELLHPEFITLNPFRGREVIDGKWKRYNSNEIVGRDIHDVLNCDLVIAEMLFKDQPYIGTSMEIRTAADAGIPVVVWTEAHKDHYWIQYHSIKCLPTLEECCKFVRDFWA